MRRFRRVNNTESSRFGKRNSNRRLSQTQRSRTLSRSGRQTPNNATEPPKSTNSSAPRSSLAKTQTTQEDTKAQQCACQQCASLRSKKCATSNARCIGPPRHLMNTLIYCTPCHNHDKMGSNCGASKVSHDDTCALGTWRNFDIASADTNFSLSRVFVARYSQTDATLLLRFHVRGKHSVSDTSISLSLPEGLVSAKGGEQDQFCIALISSDDSLTFSPGQIAPGSNSITFTHRSLRAGVMYDIWCQTFLEVMSQ